MEAKLYVGNLSHTISEDELRALFARAGTVVTVVLIKDRVTGDPKGFGFVEMANQAEAEKALSLFNAYQLGESALTVNLAKPRTTRGNQDRRGAASRLCRRHAPIRDGSR